MTRKSKKTASYLRPRDLLVHCAIAAFAGGGEPAPELTDLSEIGMEADDYDDDRTLQRLSTALTTTLHGMSALERSSAVCDLASERNAELRLVAALCLQGAYPIIGIEWCLEALAADESPMVRNACAFVLTQRGPKGDRLLGERSVLVAQREPAKKGDR